MDDLELPLAGLITNPDWSEKPDGDQLAQHYPALGQMMGLGGRVRMQCEVTSAGALDACKVLSETPRGLGFGTATLQLSTAFRMKPRTVDGVPISGGTVIIPIYFSPPVPGGSSGPPSEPVGLDGKPPSAAALAQARRLVVAMKLQEGTAASVKEGMERVLEQASAVSGDVGADPAARAQAIAALREAVDAATPALVERQARSYAAHMSEVELTQAAAFIESPAGLAFTSEQRRLATLPDSEGPSLWEAIAKEARRRFCSQAACAEPATPAPPKR